MNGSIYPLVVTGLVLAAFFVGFMIGRIVSREVRL